ncbi:GNAT family N-acetyltransferase [uncultured Draconibacterium sp.]|uniref:GNAT family N-acetyltransferase n=1 Tax=uncultured Draconibacterium sp. TaxID=1573823 RepID=UPI0029C75153|nr:GNAT family N-acetyltransferase [uncultured Draconibacterium sp.]
MELFKTERLVVKSLKAEDRVYFAELFTDPKVLELIPQKAFSEGQITDRFNKVQNFELDDLKYKKCACGIYETGNTELIGLALFLINDNNDKELGYRFRVNYWGKGYGTEITKGMLEYYFQQLKVSKVTADVNIANSGSVKILDKFMNPVSEFFNERDNCTDRRYEIEKNRWLQQWE